MERPIEPPRDAKAASKSLGQIAHEGRGSLHAGTMEFARPMAWEALTPFQRADIERMAEAVRAALSIERHAEPLEPVARYQPAGSDPDEPWEKVHGLKLHAAYPPKDPSKWEPLYRSGAVPVDGGDK